MPLPLLVPIALVLLLITLLGARLLVTGVRAGSTPEVLLGLFFLLGGSVGFGGEVAANLLSQRSPDAAAWLMRFSQPALRVPSVVIAFFTWQVFRRDSRGALAFCCLLAALQILLAASVLGGVSNRTRIDGYYAASVAASGIAFAWAAADAFAYYRGARRRAVLGLGDPVVANRFLLWSVWAGAAFAMVPLRIWLNMRFPVFTGFNAERTLLAALQTAVGLSCASALWLTFSPPEFYRRWVSSRSGTAAGRAAGA
jgi:hypothetical protein